MDSEFYKQLRGLIVLYTPFMIRKKEPDNIVDILTFKGDGIPDSIVLRLNDMEVEQLVHGADLLKYYIRGTLLGETKPISFVVRQKDTMYFKIWHAFRDAGIPVLNNLWVTDKYFGKQYRVWGETIVVQPDITADGSKLYGKAFLQQLQKGTLQQDGLDNVDLHFLRIIREQKKRIVNHLQNYIFLATKNKIMLPQDETFELHVNPNGNWSLLLLDFDAADISGTQSLTEIHEHNQHFFNRCIEKYDYIFYALLNYF